MKIILMTAIVSFLFAEAASAQTIQLKNERPTLSDSILYIGIMNNFRVSNLPAGTTIGSETVFCRLEGKKLLLMAERVGETDILFRTSSGAVFGKKHFTVKRLPNPFAMGDRRVNNRYTSVFTGSAM